MRARTARPVNVLTGRDPLGLGFTTVVHPDLVAGQPVYIDDANAPGGFRFNRLAFDSTFATGANLQARQGSLGRNVLRGFGISQVDLALRRKFSLTERIGLQFRVDAFNILNRANLANPSGVLTSGNFGVATQSLDRSLGGLGSIYQIGGPRSLQFAAKIQF